jgi:CheY-like chemotaxis protein
MMPDMDGIQVLRQLKQENPQVPVIMLTAYDYRDDFSVWVSDAYVVKSSDLSTLKTTIKQILEKK